MKNDLIRRREAERRELLNRGMAVGEQYMVDMMLVCLHRQGWGYERAKRLLDQIDAACNEFADVFFRRMEQDIRQEQLDRELRDLVKDNEPFHPFAERYPEIITLGYDKLPKE